MPRGNERRTAVLDEQVSVPDLVGGDIESTEGRGRNAG
jgi:hypothetical protein